MTKRAAQSKASALSETARLREEIGRAALEVAPDAVVITGEDGTILLANRQAETVFGYDRDELIGMSIEHLMPENERARHAAHRANYANNPHTRPMGQGLELSAQRKDGSLLPVEISLSPLTEGGVTHAVAIIRDITPRQQLEAALRRAEAAAAARAREAESQLALLQLIVDALPSGVYLVRGAAGRLVLANHAAQLVWGAPWPRGQAMTDFLAQSGVSILGSDGLALTEDDLATLRVARTGAGIRQFQEVVRRPDGARMPILLNAVALPASVLALGDAESGTESEPGALVVLQDVAALKETERLKDEFIGIAAHELRNPLAALRGFAEMLSLQTARGHGPPLADWQAEAVAAIDVASQRLVEMTDDLLDVTRLQSGRLELHRHPEDLVALVCRCVARAQGQSPRHAITLAAPLEPLVLPLDATRIEQVVGNLLTNAIKYSPAGGTIAVEIRPEPAANRVVVRVRDSGIGIPADQQSKLFNRFARADNAQTLGIPGTGLGLYLCRELVERHGGRIWLASAAGQGATFAFSLPLRDPEGERDTDQTIG